MRLMFFVILIVNISYLSWHMAVGIDAPSPAVLQPQWQTNNPLELLEERPPITVAKDLTNIEAAGKAAACIGPFDQEADASDALNRLSALGQASVIKSRQVVAEQDYWVFMPSMASPAEALATIEQLKSGDIEGFLIQSGDDSPGVSIGLFTRKINAQQQQVKVKALGLVSQTREVQRYRQRYALLLTTEADAVNVDELVEILHGSWPNLQSQENLCKAVAPD